MIVSQQKSKKMDQQNRLRLGMFTLRTNHKENTYLVSSNIYVRQAKQSEIARCQSEPGNLSSK
jgi:hypothetical protein